jgi:hypothetical protein
VSLDSGVAFGGRFLPGNWSGARLWARPAAPGCGIAWADGRRPCFGERNRDGDGRRRRINRRGLGECDNSEPDAELPSGLSSQDERPGQQTQNESQSPHFLAPSAPSTVRFRDSGVQGWDGCTCGPTCGRDSTNRSKDEARRAFATPVAVERADEPSPRGGMAGHLCPRRAAQWSVAPPQHCLNFLPDPHGHGSLRPIFGAMRRTVVSLSDCISRDRCDAKWR